MKFSLTVDSRREAGYATSMFAALQAAMTANPPPVAQFSQTSIGEVSHTTLTGYPSTGIAPSGPYDVKLQTAADTSEAGEQEDDTGTDATTAATGTTPGKKRGRKSAEQKAAEALAKAAADENALRPGAALQGVSALSLAQALQGMPLVFEGDGMQVRTAPDTPPDEIAAMRERLQAQDAQIKSEEATAAAEQEAKAAAQAAKDAAAASKAAAVTVAPPATVVEPPVTAKPAVDDDILASLFKKKEEPPVQQVAPPATSRFASMNAAELRAAFIEYINNEGGLLWARNVMEHFKLGTLEDLTPDNTRAVLENPERFRSAA